MKICLYSPYIPKHHGGGELYLLQVAQALLQGHDVFLAIPDTEFDPKKSIASQAKKILASYTFFFGIKIAKLKIIPTPIGTKASWWKKWQWTNQWDVFYHVTDGSVFPSFARTSIMHVQVPLLLDKRSVWERFKISFWNVINTNSHFTKSIISKKWPIEVDCVHSPYVELPKKVTSFKIENKEKIILHVGRFFQQLHSKRQDAIVETFHRLVVDHPKAMKGWKLVFVGGIEDEAYAELIHAMAKDLPVEFYHDVDREEILTWIQKASIYWHATGYGLDAKKHPEKLEHFGISTIEAMAGGCVPVVIKAGGQVEVLGEELKEWLWTNQDQWITQTLKVVQNKELRQELAIVARKRAATFSRSHFEEQLQLMIHGSY
jgi:glycosyltransferase involved in cell wall biosynthesis